MPTIRLTGSVRKIDNLNIVLELSPDCREKLQRILDELPSTSNRRFIHPSGSFLIKHNNQTKFENISGLKWDHLEDLVGATLVCTVKYSYYKFTDEFTVNDGYTFKALIVRV